MKYENWEWVTKLKHESRNSYFPKGFSLCYWLSSFVVVEYNDTNVAHKHIFCLHLGAYMYKDKCTYLKCMTSTNPEEKVLSIASTTILYELHLMILLETV